MARAIPSVVLVGRPNVGKSTLFNRLTHSRRAIVTAIPGTTRDVLAQRVQWQESQFELTDTGGMFGASEDPLHALVLERGHRAITEADLRSEEHTSELQSRLHLVCRLLLEKKKR